MFIPEFTVHALEQCALLRVQPRSICYIIDCRRFKHVTHKGCPQKHFFLKWKDVAQIYWDDPETARLVNKRLTVVMDDACQVVVTIKFEEVDELRSAA